MKYTIKTKGLMCGHCEASVEASLLKVPGVTDADADHDTNTVEVEASAPVTEDALKDAVHAAGDNFYALTVQTA